MWGGGAGWRWWEVISIVVLLVLPFPIWNAKFKNISHNRKYLNFGSTTRSRQIIWNGWDVFSLRIPEISVILHSCNKCVNMYIFGMYICIHMHEFIPTCVCVCMYIYMCVYAYTNTYIYAYVYVRVYTYVYMYMCTYVYAQIHIYICMNTYK